MHWLLSDLRYAMRVLSRSREFTTIAVLVLALAMGATTAIFSVLDAVLLRPLPYRDSQRLCVLWKSVPARNIEWDWTSYPTIRDWREQNRVFEGIAVILRPEASRVTVHGAEGTEKIQGSKVAGSFFETLGVAPVFGRTFSRDESERGETLVVLSHAFWQQRFQSDRAVLGRALQLDNRNFTIVGVMPTGFQFPDKTAQLWLPLATDPNWPAYQKVRFADAFYALGRLRPGVSLQQARSGMNAVAARIAQQFPATDRALGIRVVALYDQIAEARLQRTLWVLGAAVLCVLLIACSNIASLLIARGASRRRELAVRAALGAGRGRLLWQLTAENVLLSLVGTIAGLPIAYGGLHALLALAPADLPRSNDIGINATVFAFTFGLCLATGLIFGLLPAFQIAGRDPHGGLHARGRGSSFGPEVSRTRGLLVASQFALAIVLLAGAGLLIRSFLLLNAVHPGFDTTHLLTMTIRLPDARYNDESSIAAFFDEAIRKVEALPGVRAAAVGSAVTGTLRGNVPNESIVIEGHPPTENVPRHGRELVSNGYFSAMGIPLYRGRLFSSGDKRGGPSVAVINEAMADRFWPSENAIGKRFKQVLPGMDNPWITVVGVVGDVLYNRDGAVVPIFYRPIQQWSLIEMPLVVRTEHDPLNLIAAVRREVRSVDRAVPYFEIATAEQRLEELDRPRRFQTELIGLFAVTALILAALGLYGLMSYSVERRRKEIGIRVALGATSGQVARLIVGQSLRWALAGVVIGIGGALAFGHALSSFLFGISGADLVTLAAVTAVLAAVTAAASILPTSRATRVDPNIALREE
jgi:putative ABC transport system permease protein